MTIEQVLANSGFLTLCVFVACGHRWWRSVRNPSCVSSRVLPSGRVKRLYSRM